ncbi:MAG: ABC transporter permease [Clostridia bacterium]|nr:ABC transporter permease [Clostridia bacterium]
MIRSAFTNLVRKPGRSFLTLLSVSIGVFSICLISMISSYGRSAINSELNSLGMNGLLVASENEINPDITQEEIDAVRQIPSINQAAGLVVTTAQASALGEEIEIYLWGIGTDAKKVVDLNLEYGRHLSDYDMSTGAQVCMVDSAFAKQVYGRENVVGKTISVNCSGYTVNYEIVGVVQTGSGLLSGMMGEYIPDFVYTVDKNVQQALKTTGFHRIAVMSDENSNTDMVCNRILKRLSSVTGDNEGFTVTNLAKQKQSLSNIMDIVSIVLYCVGIISLVVASIGIMTVMLVSVSERTAEIGIKKSIGASKSIIIKEFLCESLVLSLIGCLIGIILCLCVAILVRQMFDLNMMISGKEILISIAISMLTGISFGVYPAIRASNLKPVDALRMN